MTWASGGTVVLGANRLVGKHFNNKLEKERRCKMTRKRVWLRAAILTVMFSSLLACQTPAGRSTGEVIDDATITTKVKAKLFDESILRGFAISVDTFEGEVTLTGAVDTDAQRERAAETARSVTGVKQVKNLIKLKKS
jgi:hyperosmotically inducible protein